MTEELDGMGANPEGDEHDGVVDSLQAGGEAGDHASSGNDEGDLEDSHNGDGEDLEDDEDPGEGDETDEGPPLVTRLRQEAARHRRRLRDRERELEDLRGELWTERVRALGVLADPEDLEFDPEALEDPDRLRELAEDLLARKPHLRTRRIRARAGQGEGSSDGEVSLAALLRRGA